MTARRRLSTPQHAPTRMLGTRLRFHRDAKGLTQRDLGKLADVPQFIVARLELDKHVPHPDQYAVKLAAALDIDHAAFVKSINWKHYGYIAPPPIKQPGKVNPAKPGTLKSALEEIAALRRAMQASGMFAPPPPIK